MSKDPNMMRLQPDDLAPGGSSVKRASPAGFKGRRQMRRHHTGGESGSGVAHQRLWRRPKILPAGLELQLGFNQNNAQETADASRKEQWVHSYHSYYHPPMVNTIHDSDLPIHYWFYIYTHSNEIDLILRPFGVSKKKWPTDKRLWRVMKRNKVKLVLQDFEFYKSLPRRLIVIMAPDWDHILSTLADLEMSMPGMMKYASYPLLMDTSTNRYPCTNNCTTIFTRGNSGFC